MSTGADDLSLTRRLAHLMGWEVREGSVPGTEPDSRAVYIDQNGTLWRWYSEPRYQWLPWRPLQSMDDALLIMHHFETAGCSAWVECDGHTGRRGGVTTGAGRFEAEADTEARAFCYAALKSRGVEVSDA